MTALPVDGCLVQTIRIDDERFPIPAWTWTCTIHGLASELHLCEQSAKKQATRHLLPLARMN